MGVHVKLVIFTSIVLAQVVNAFKGCINSRDTRLSSLERTTFQFSGTTNSHEQSSSEVVRAQLNNFFRAIAAPVAILASTQVVIAADEGTIEKTAPRPAEPQITHKAFLDIKIANYTEESIGKNRAGKGSGRVVVGLYGKEAPKSVQLFLDTIKAVNDTVGTAPSYYNSQFTRITEDGLLEIEKVRGINTVTLAGRDQLEYGGNVLNFEPILETNNLRHNRRGLLTRTQLTAGPEFGISLKETGGEALDQFHVVFGAVLEGFEVLDAIEGIPVYTYNTKTGYGGEKRGAESGVADAWFSTQKKLFVGVGQSFGDMRAVDRRGKLLRRVTIKNTGIV